jgi:ribosomal protein L44E
MCDVCGSQAKPKIVKFKHLNGTQSWYYHCLECDVTYVDEALARLNKLEKMLFRGELGE